MVDDPYPHGEVTAIYSGAVNPHLINISVSVGEPAPEVTTPSEELTAVVQMSMPIKDIIIDDTCINVEFYDFVQNGLDYSYLTLASGKVVDGPLTTAQQKQQSSNENKENTEGTLYIIDRLYEQGLLQPVTETPLHTIMRQIKNQP